MPRKIDLLQEVYQTQLATLTYSREVWCSFLRTAAFQYKYSFPDQVLIWSQRPHARACAELELWNKVFDRWVNRHAKGIALIKDKGSYTGIRYVFDVADTHGRHGEELKLWQVRNGYHDDVTEALENRFGELEDDSSFVASVISACQNAVEDNMTDYLSDLSHLTENSALQGMDEDNLKVRLRSILILMGSTFKMGAGTNVQERLIALHDLDVPWRPSDLEQRLGRIVRQGNSNPEVEIYRYVTEGTFDAYMYQLLESKQKFISQIMTSKSPVRCAEDVDDTALSYAEIKALASGNPKIMEKMQLDADVAKLKLQKSAHLSERYMLEDQLFKDFPKEVSEEEERIAGYGADIEIAKENTHKDEKGFSPMIVQGKEITVKAEAGKAILAFCKKMTNPDLRPLGEYRGFKTEIGFDIFGREFFMMLRGNLGHRVTLGQDANGIITRLDNAIDSFFTKQCHCKERLSELKQQIENAKREVATPFPREEELTEKLKRLDELNAELNMDKPENELVDGERDGDETPSESKESRPENDRQEREQDDDREEECR